MHEYDLHKTFRVLLEFMVHPVGVFKRFADEPDILGALLVLDVVAFLSVLLAVVSGYVQFHLSWGFLIRFVVLYLMMLVVFLMLTGFEAGVSVFGADLMGKKLHFASMFSVIGFAKMPLVFAAVLYMVLPEKLGIGSLIELTSNHTPLQHAFSERFELFEVMSFLIAVAGLKTVSGLRLVTCIGILLVGWLVGTPLFYCVTTSIF